MHPNANQTFSARRRALCISAAYSLLVLAVIVLSDACWQREKYIDYFGESDYGLYDLVTTKNFASLLFSRHAWLLIGSFPLMLAMLWVPALRLEGRPIGRKARLLPLIAGLIILVALTRQSITQVLHPLQHAVGIVVGFSDKVMGSEPPEQLWTVLRQLEVPMDYAVYAVEEFYGEHGISGSLLILLVYVLIYVEFSLCRRQSPPLERRICSLCLYSGLLALVLLIPVLTTNLLVGLSVYDQAPAMAFLLCMTLPSVGPAFLDLFHRRWLAVQTCSA